MTKEKEEVWKEVPGYSSYMTSSRGRVKSLKFGKERIMKQTLCNKGGYLKVGLSKECNKKQFKVHQLIAMTFLGHVLCGHRIEVNHIDGDKTNNNLSNLELLTRREHAIVTWKSKYKTSSYAGVSWSKQNKKWVAQIYIDDKIKYLGSFEDEVLASEAYQKALKEI